VNKKKQKNFLSAGASSLQLTGQQMATGAKWKKFFWFFFFKKRTACLTATCLPAIRLP
jgi:hypothetical protein